MKRTMIGCILLLLTGCGLAQQTQDLSDVMGVNAQCPATPFQLVLPAPDGPAKACFADCVAAGVGEALCHSKCDKLPPPRVDRGRCAIDCIIVDCEDIVTCSRTCYDTPRKYPPRDSCVDFCVKGGVDAGLCESKCYKMELAPGSDRQSCMSHCLRGAGEQGACERACHKLFP